MCPVPTHIQANNLRADACVRVCVCVCVETLTSLSGSQNLLYSMPVSTNRLLFTAMVPLLTSMTAILAPGTIPTHMEHTHHVWHASTRGLDGPQLAHNTHVQTHVGYPNLARVPCTCREDGYNVPYV